MKLLARRCADTHVGGRLKGFASLRPSASALAAAGCLGAGSLLPHAAKAADYSALSLDAIYQNQGVAGVSIFLGLVLLTSVTAILHLTGRKRWLDREAALSSDLMEARAQLDRANVFLSAEPQIVIAFAGPSGEPEIAGDLSLVTETPAPRRVLGFGSWLAPEAARQLEGLTDRLRSRGEAFRLAVTSQSGRHLDIEGRAIGGRAIMRIRDVSGDRLDLARLRERHAETLAETGALRAMLDAIPNPVWMRKAEGDLVWVNHAFLRAVECPDRDQAITQKVELLDRDTREAAAKARVSGETWRAKSNAVVAGARHMLDIVDVPGPTLSVGIATDLSEIEAVRTDLELQMQAHARTLDQLTTGVAIFDRTKRLVFHNAAYRQIWSLDPAFLDQRPSDGEVLDHLRATRKLPEQADFRAWKADILGHYHSMEPTESGWYLPDGRTLRVVVNPNPQGGVTYLFDDVSERFHLESQYNGLIRVQGETLDSLKEGVAVFGTDGRLKLANPAIAAIWRLEPGALAQQPHIDELTRAWSALAPDQAGWGEVRALVAGLQDARRGCEHRFARRDGTFVDCTAAPLPDGATLLTFTDVTAGVNVERALTERNKALMEAEQLRNDFVHHVSYELRSPLTHIIGFSELLSDQSIGPLNDKQREYTGYIRKSSAALLAIINDILDLATIDTDAMTLSLGPVDVRQTIASAVEGVQDRLQEAALRLQVVAGDDIGIFEADGKRVRQILFNLLSNAIGFSDSGQTVTLAALRRGEDVVFKVSDQGRGIPPDMLDRVFERFETNANGSRHRGVGLGLSIVRSFVELHGGKVFIDSAPGEGTTVTCIFPARSALSLDEPARQKA